LSGGSNNDKAVVAVALANRQDNLWVVGALESGAEDKNGVAD